MKQNIAYNNTQVFHRNAFLIELLSMIFSIKTTGIYIHEQLIDVNAPKLI